MHCPWKMEVHEMDRFERALEGEFYVLFDWSNLKFTGHSPAHQRLRQTLFMNQLTWISEWKWQSNDYLCIISIQSISSIWENIFFSFSHMILCMSRGGRHLGFSTYTKKNTYKFFVKDHPRNIHPCLLSNGFDF
jgi:hypothetical protein